MKTVIAIVYLLSVVYTIPTSEESSSSESSEDKTSEESSSSEDKNRIKIFDVNHKSDEDDDSSDSETDEDTSDEDKSNEKEQEPEGSDSEDDYEDSEHEDSKEEDGNSSNMDTRHYRRGERCSAGKGDDGCEDSSDEYGFQDIGDDSYAFSEELLMHGDEPEEFQSW
ncbi:UNVERIFIED_CONTAM: hypothetical protein FKN15_007682 [Acipenser sinensis]